MEMGTAINNRSIKVAGIFPLPWVGFVTTFRQRLSLQRMCVTQYILPNAHRPEKLLMKYSAREQTPISSENHIHAKPVMPRCSRIQRRRTKRNPLH